MRAAQALAVGALLLSRGAPAGEPEGRPGRVEVVSHRRSEMVLVPAGTFTMGFSATEDHLDKLRRACTEELGAHFGDTYCRMEPHPGQVLAPYDATPERKVFLSAYEIDRREVTVSDYRACVAGGGCDVAPLLSGDTRYLGDDLPMVNVTWQDASDYCAFAGKRLPSEAEWEKAARGTDGRIYPWGDHTRRDGANHGRTENPAMAYTHSFLLWHVPLVPAERVPDESDGGKYALPPGTLVWGESPYGAMDMAGNVAEWVRDYYAEATTRRGEAIKGGYEDLPVTDPVRLSPKNRVTRRVVRGGSWLDPLLWARTYWRESAPPGSRSALRGFRCARDVR